MSVIKAIEFPGKEFNSQNELFYALKESKDKIIEMKKMPISSDSIKSFPIKIDSELGKANHFEEGFLYPVINTTKYLDSHNDVHLDGIWTKSLKEQQKNIHYLVNHELKIGSVIAYPKDVVPMVMDLAWKSIGANFDGTTEALIFKVTRSAIDHPDALKIINEKIDIQHSVRMQYVKMFMAMDSDSNDFKEEKANFEKYKSLVVNQDVLNKNGYFWGIEEAKLFKEGSMVLGGSNDITPMQYPEKSTEPPNSTPPNEPSKDTHSTKSLLFI